MYGRGGNTGHRMLFDANSNIFRLYSIDETGATQIYYEFKLDGLYFGHKKMAGGRYHGDIPNGTDWDTIMDPWGGLKVEKANDRVDGGDCGVIIQTYYPYEYNTVCYCERHGCINSFGRHWGNWIYFRGEINQ